LAQPLGSAPQFSWRSRSRSHLATQVATDTPTEGWNDHFFLIAQINRVFYLSKTKLQQQTDQPVGGVEIRPPAQCLNFKNKMR